MPFLDLGDTQIHYNAVGSGRPLLLISGTAIHGEVWRRHQVPEFSRDHRVIIYDQRGTGQSKTNSKDFSINRLANDAAALLDCVGAQGAIVLGHSMGGRVAQILALDHKEKVTKLILASSGASFPSRGIPVELCLQLVEKGFDRFIRESSLKNGFTKSFIEENNEIVEEFLAVRLAKPPKLEDFLRVVIARQETDTSSRLMDIRVPTLVTVGDDEDHAEGVGITHMQSSLVLAEGIPGAKFVVIPGQGHYYPYVDPKPFHAILRDFLRGN
jgi:pimeloyl-ACP methyl ester carboxylesterase